MRTLKGIILSALLFCCVGAQAVIITLDAGDHAPGTDLLQPLPGLTITSHSQFGSPTFAPGQFETRALLFGGLTTIGGFYGDVGNAATCLERTRAGLTSITCEEGFVFLQMAFADAADFVSITSIRGLEPAGIVAFDSSGNIIASCGTQRSLGMLDRTCDPVGNVTPDHFTTSLGIDSRLISSIWYGGTLGGFVNATSLSYNIPEPSTGLLFAAALMVMGIATRRRTGAR